MAKQTKKDAVSTWLKNNPGRYRITSIQSHLISEGNGIVSRSTISGALSELHKKYPDKVFRVGRGRTDRWTVGDWDNEPT